MKPAAAVKPTVPRDALTGEPDMSKFEDEDAGEPEPEKKFDVVKPQAKKKEVKKWMKDETVQDKPLDDPVAEKLRRQRLVEEADLAAAKDLFGGGDGGINLDLFLPKSVKDFDDFAATLVNRYVLPHKDSKNFKVLIKAIARKACEPLGSGDVKEVESAVGVVRAEKVKAENAAKSKSAGKKTLNIGKSGLSAGLDDYVYDDAGDGDDDFM